MSNMSGVYVQAFTMGEFDVAPWVEEEEEEEVGDVESSTGTETEMSLILELPSVPSHIPGQVEKEVRCDWAFTGDAFDDEVRFEEVD